MKLAQPGKIISPILLELEQNIKNDPSKSKELLDSFWEKIIKQGTPLFEKEEGEEQYIVTFLFREKVTTMELSVNCEIFGILPERAKMKQIQGTDVHFVSCYVLPKTKLRYHMVRGIRQLHNFFDPQDVATTKTKDFVDPLNKFSKEIKTDQNDPEPSSLLITPDADSEYWSINRGNPKGTLQERNIEATESLREQIQNKLSKQHENSFEKSDKKTDNPYAYKVVIYTPPGYDKSQDSYPFMLTFDGDSYIHDDLVPTHIIFDNLIAEGKISPTIGIFIHHKNRNDELLQNYEFAKFIVEKVIPTLRKEFRLSIDPKQAVVAGSSYGGLCSMYFGLNFPHVFGKILCQSGSFWAPSSHKKTDFLILIDQFVEKNKVDLDIYMSIGFYEGKEELFDVPTHFYSNYHMRNVLRLKGYNYKFEEVNGGHDYMNWRETIAHGLIFLIGNPDTNIGG